MILHWRIRTGSEW